MPSEEEREATRGLGKEGVEEEDAAAGVLEGALLELNEGLCFCCEHNGGKLHSRCSLYIQKRSSGTQ